MHACATFLIWPPYDSPSVPITWSRLEYCAGTNEYVQIDPSLKSQVLDLYQENPEEARKQFGDEPFELKNILQNWVRSKHQDFHVIPTDTVFVTIDKEAVRKSGMMMASDTIPDKMVISLKGKNALYKNDLMMLEMIAQCNWTRPIYVALTVGSENYMNLGDNFVQEGLANRITPFTTNKSGAKSFDTEKTYDNVMHKFKFGGIDQQGIYLDETVTRMCFTHRRLMAQLALALAQEGKKEKAKDVLAKCEKEIPGMCSPSARRRFLPIMYVTTIRVVHLTSYALMLLRDRTERHSLSWISCGRKQASTSSGIAHSTTPGSETPCKTV